MPGVNPLVQRSLQARGGTAQPTHSLEQAQLRQQQAWQQAQAQPMPSVTSAPTGGGGGGDFWSQMPGADGKIDLQRILATIRNRESGGDYSARNKVSSASGAYQFIDSTWNNYGGYRQAWMAPRQVQDAKAMADVQRFLSMSNNDLSAVPGMWYRPATYQNRSAWDSPIPGPGNPLTMRQYITKWLNDYYGR